jgi:glycerophosphoryl diester phosphodiesterase
MYKIFIFCLIVCTWQCMPGNKQALLMEKQLNIQGHRGCRGLMPENTVAAMLKALELGVTTLEMDIVITGDGQVILSHEPFFNHEISTKPNGQPVTEAEEKQLNIFNMPLDSVWKYDVGLKPHPRFVQQLKTAAVKPLLSQVFDAVNNWNANKRRKQPVYYNIEIKSLPQYDNLYHPIPSVFCEKLMEVINKYKLQNEVTIQSFDWRNLQYLHKQYPSQQLAMLVEDDNKAGIAAHLKELGFTPAIYSPHYSLVTKELVTYCNQKNMQLIPWTVNDKATINKLVALGVHGIITDYPNLITDSD